MRFLCILEKLLSASSGEPPALRRPGEVGGTPVEEPSTEFLCRWLGTAEAAVGAGADAAGLTSACW